MLEVVYYELAYAVADAGGAIVEWIKCYVGITEKKITGKFDEAIQKLFLETQADQLHQEWSQSATTYTHLISLAKVHSACAAS